MRHSFFKRRTLSNFILTVILWVLAVLAAIPLFSVLFMLIVRGGARVNIETLTSLPPAGFMPGGGVGNAIVGTLVVVFLAAPVVAQIGADADRLLGGKPTSALIIDESSFPKTRSPGRRWPACITRIAGLTRRRR